MVVAGWARGSGLHPAPRALRGALEALAKNLRREEGNRLLFLSSLIIKKLHWPEQELAKKSILNAEDSVIIDSKRSLSHLSSGVLKDIFTTGTSSYNVLLQSKEEKKHHSQKQSSSTYSKRCRKPSKSANISRSKDPHRMKALVPVTSSGTWYCLERRPAVFVTSSVSSPVKFTHDISVSGNAIVLPPKPKSKVKRCHFSTLQKPKSQSQLSRSFEKGDDFSGKKFCILTAIKPTNLEKEKLRFFKSDYTYNPQFEYANPALPSVLTKHSHASDRFLKQVKCHSNRGSSFLCAKTIIYDFISKKKKI
uniref:Microtubule associated tyrosine carboxypeptidase 2 n=1 Tax=Saimiri boliviensis boliviensis TaxID=39432 RepID=A0A2K6TT36_SAIBB